MYITNIQEKIKGTTNDAQNNGKNSGEYEDKKSTARSRALGKSSPINPNDDLKDYRESGIENKREGENGKRRQRK